MDKAFLGWARAGALAVFAALLLAAPSQAGRAAGGAPSLGLPIDCVPGQTCWIAKFVDLDPGPGVRDYMCTGRANDRHSGVDIALRDLRAMDAGVAVVASAPGTVLRTRDGVPDISARALGPEMMKGGECGNGVIIDHGNGWWTQYCHMRQGSIAVKPGQKVAAGEKLGLVGMSGSSEYPHLHLSVLHDKAIVDPFVGTDGRANGTDCGIGTSPLWSEAALKALAYTPASIYNVGVAPAPPDQEDIRKGRLRDLDISPVAPVFILWCEIYGVEAGDVLHMKLTGPKGGTLVEDTKTLKARKARWYQYIGKRRHGFEWPPGAYKGVVTLTRNVNGAKESTSVVIEAHVAALPGAAPDK